MLENIKCLGHSTIKMVSDNKVIYFDPYNIKLEYKDADIIFITHSHYDHFSEDDINKIKKENTKIVISKDIYDNVLKLGFLKDNIIVVTPNNNYQIDNINFNTIPAYNIDKAFHSKNNNWVGYIFNINNYKYYIAGDTDITEENKKVICDVAFLPIGGIYTMDYKEAATLANIIEPRIVVPIHYGTIVGNIEDAYKFKELLNDNIRCEIMIK